MDVHGRKSTRRKKGGREKEKRNEGVSVMTVEVTKAQTDSKTKKKRVRAGLRECWEQVVSAAWRWFLIQD